MLRDSQTITYIVIILELLFTLKIIVLLCERLLRNVATWVYITAVVVSGTLYRPGFYIFNNDSYLKF